MYNEFMKRLFSSLLLLSFLFFTTSTNLIAATPNKSQKKSDESMTLDDYEKEDSEPTTETKTQAKHNNRSPHHIEKKSSHTQIDFGAGLTTGSWSAGKSNSTALFLGLSKMFVPQPVYVKLSAQTFISPATPRNYFFSGSVSAGAIYAQHYTAPHIGFKAGAARLIVQGGGRAFGAVLGPEVGFYPFRIKTVPIAMNFQYNWLTSRVRGEQPRWFALTLGALF